MQRMATATQTPARFPSEFSLEYCSAAVRSWSRDVYVGESVTALFGCSEESSMHHTLSLLGTGGVLRRPAERRPSSSHRTNSYCPMPSWHPDLGCPKSVSKVSVVPCVYRDTCPCYPDGRRGENCGDSGEAYCPNQCTGHGDCHTGFCM